MFRPTFSTCFMLGEVATDLPKSADSESDDSADDFELLEGIANFAFACFRSLKFIYSKKAKKICAISTVDLTFTK